MGGGGVQKKTLWCDLITGKEKKQSLKKTYSGRLIIARPVMVFLPFFLLSSSASLSLDALLPGNSSIIKKKCILETHSATE